MKDTILPLQSQWLARRTSFEILHIRVEEAARVELAVERTRRVKDGTSLGGLAILVGRVVLNAPNGGLGTSRPTIDPLCEKAVLIRGGKLCGDVTILAITRKRSIA